MLAMLSALYLVFVVGLRYMRRSQVYGHLQQQSSQALQKISRDVANSMSDQMISDNGTPPYLWFATSELAAPSAEVAHYDSTTGLLQYQKWLCYYLDVSQSQLIRCELPFSGGPQTAPLISVLPNPTLPLFQAAPRQIVARTITDLETAVDTGTCRIRVTASEYNGSQRCSVEANSQIVLLND